MMTVQVFLRVSLFALLIVDTCGFPSKVTKSKDQTSSPSKAAVDFASDQGAAIRGFTAVPYRAQSDSSILVQAPSLNQAGPGIGSSGSYVLSPVGQSSGVVPFVQMDPASGSLSSTVPLAGYSVASGYMPAQAGYDAISTQPEDAPSGVQETEWVIPPMLFSEDDLTNTQALSLADVLPPAPLPPPEPVLQSGETSSVMKEAELGNYQQLTEEFGYPADPVVPGQRFTSVPASPFGVGVFKGYPYPNFDYRLLYGMYPPGTYSTFSQQHEKGKDHFQDVHYLTEHITDGHDTGQQKKFFPSAPQSSVFATSP